MFTGRCHKHEMENEICYGGMGRMFTAVQQLQKDVKDSTLVLNAGDYFQVD